MSVSTRITFTVIDEVSSPAARIENVTLSANQFIEGSPDGTVIGAISVDMADGDFAGSLSLGGSDASHFRISESDLVLNGVQGAGTHEIDIIATQTGATGSPFTKHVTVTGTEVFEITGISLSNDAFSEDASSGTVIGVISVQTLGGAFFGSLSLAGTDASRFAIVGNSLVLQGAQVAGSYSIDIVATQEGSVGSPFVEPFSITGEEVSSPPDPPPPPNADNVIAISNQSGASQASYPWQFGRPFVEGEIPDYPQVLIDDVPVFTQADVKNRHPDGSVKYAVLALIAPSIPTSGSLSVTFQNQASGNNTPLTKAQMLDASYNFDARMQLAFVGGATGSASARTMLNAGHYTLWTSGSIAQTIELADDTAARTYDLGNGDGYRPFRPRFYATFWPSLGKVFVRYVGENGLTTELEDLKYNLTLTIGNVSPQTVYSIDLTGGPASGGKLHWTTTNWTKRFWIGGAPERKINVDYNLAYLAATRYAPNFDTSLTMPEPAIASLYTRWTGRTNDLYDGMWNSKGAWTDGMATPGQRPEIGPYPSWTTALLYTGDWRMREMALGMADLAGGFPANMRESATDKNLLRTDPPGAGTGLGKAVSISNRPTSHLYNQANYSYSSTKPADRVTIVGPISVKWTFDGAHQPAPFYVEYIITGDPYYLNEMYMWAGLSAARYNGAAFAAAYGRGPTGAEGGINDELRGGGWVMRNRAEAAHAAPDDDPMKAYLTTLVSDALARWEGGFGITGTELDGDPTKVWGALRGNFYSSHGGGVTSGQPVPLCNWNSNGNPLNPAGNATITQNVKDGIWQANKVGSFTSYWMQHFVLYGVGRTLELGFPAGPVFEYSARWLVEMTLDSGNPLLAGTYQTPVERPGGGFMAWTEILTDGFTASYLTNTLPGFVASQLHPEGRIVWALPGAAYAVDAGVSRAAAMRAWFQTEVIDEVAPSFNTNPKWAIVPR